MSTRSEQPPPSENARPQDGRAIEWRIHPVTRKPWVSAGVICVVLLFTLLVQISTESRFFTALALVVLLASLAKFFFPTTYRLTEKEVIVKTTTQTLRKEWSQYRTYWVDRNGVLLSPFAASSRLENFRGLFLIFGNNREEVIAFIKERMPASQGENV